MIMIEPTEKDLVEILETTERKEEALKAESLLRRKFGWDDEDIYVSLYQNPPLWREIYCESGGEK